MWRIPNQNFNKNYSGSNREKDCWKPSSRPIRLLNEERNTRSHFVLGNFVEKSFKVNKNLYFAFIDLLKAFDRVNCDVMMKKLKMIKIDYRYSRIIREWYKHQTTSIEINESKEEATIRKGVRQGCNNIYIEQAINECTRINLNGMGI